MKQVVLQFTTHDGNPLLDFTLDGNELEAKAHTPEAIATAALVFVEHVKTIWAQEMSKAASRTVDAEEIAKAFITAINQQSDADGDERDWCTWEENEPEDREFFTSVFQRLIDQGVIA